MGRITEAVKVLLITNFLFFLGTGLVGQDAFSYLSLWFFKNDNFQYWQLITHIFMHGGADHIFFNMIWLFMLGPFLETGLGKNKFLFIYFSAGIGALVFQFLFQYLQYYPGYEALLSSGHSFTEIQNFYETTSYKSNVLNIVDESVLVDSLQAYHSRMVGASGAISGIMGAVFVMYPNHQIVFPFPMKLKYLIGFYLAIDIFSAFKGTALFGPTNVAYWAHIGGAIVGALVALYWKKNSFNQNRWD